MRRTLAFILILSLLPVYSFAADDEDKIYNDPYNPSQVVKEYRSMDVDVSKLQPHAEGKGDYLDFMRKYDFTDVENYNKRAATELAAIGVTFGTGINTFGANINIKNIEAIAMFLRMFGADEAVRKRVMEQNPDAKGELLNKYIYDAYVVEARNRGILPAESSLNYYADAVREDIATWFVKAANITNPEPKGRLKEATDSHLISAYNYPNVETLVDLEIMTLNFGNAFGARKPMHRQDFARLLSNTIDRFGDNLNVKKHLGIVLGFKKTKDAKGEFIDVVMRTPENELASIRYGSPSGASPIGFPVLDGKLKEPSAIKIGEELEYIVRDGKVLLARTLYANEVKTAIVGKYAADPEVEIIQGEVKSVLEDNTNTDKAKLSRTRIRVELDDDRVVDFIEERNLLNGIDNQLLVKDRASFIKPKNARVGEAITAYIKKDNVLFMQMGRENIVVYKGTLRSISKNTEPPMINILTLSGDVVSMPLTPDTNYSTNKYRVEMKDLKPGAFITILSVRGVAEFVKTESYQPPEGHIPKKGKILFAEVLKVGSNSLTLKGDIDYASISPATVIKKGGINFAINRIVPGDRVKLYYDDINSQTPSMIELEAYGPVIEKIVKAKIRTYSKAKQMISIADPYYMRSTIWTPEKTEYLSDLKLARDIEIYSRGTKIEPADIGANHINQTAYMVIRDNFNSKEVAKLVFQAGYEKLYEDSVRNYDNALNRMSLAGGRTIAYGDDTIIVKDERLVGKGEISADTDLSVVANELSGADFARVLMIGSGEIKNMKNVYVGTIENINTYSLLLSNYADIDKYKFNKTYSGTKRLNFSDDTPLYDATKDKLISRQAFFNGDYYPRRVESTGNSGLRVKRYYGFFITDGRDNIIAAKFRYKGFVEKNPIDDKITSENKIRDKVNEVLQRTTFTKGKIASFDVKWNRVSLYDSYNYFDFHSEWRPNDKVTTFSLRNAIIIKNGEMIEYRDLRVDDKVSAVRDDEDCYILFVE